MDISKKNKKPCQYCLLSSKSWSGICIQIRYDTIRIWGKGLGDFLVNWSQSFTMTTPWSIKFHQNILVAIMNNTIEIDLIQNCDKGRGLFDFSRYGYKEARKVVGVKFK